MRLKKIVKKIKYGILVVDGYWTKIKRIIFNAFYPYRYLKKNYLIVLFIIQIIIILLLGYYVLGFEIFKKKVIAVGVIFIYVMIIRYVYRIILKYFGWKGKYPIGNLPKLEQFFKKHKIINYVCKVILKYVNVWRIMLILRNKTMIMMRYVRYIFYKMGSLKYLVKVEKVITYICTEIL